MTFGEKIRYLREIREMTQLELGFAIGLSQRKVSYLECDRFEPDMADLRALCRYFSISADYLLELPRGLSYPER